MSQRVEEEIEHVREVIGLQVPIAGFYSYENPFNGETACNAQSNDDFTTISE
jgi:hypothetical protein